MSAATDAAAPAGLDHHPMRAATRTTTIMFTDLVGSTELSERLGSGEARRVRDRHFAALRDSLSVHRGIEVKTLGDGIMATFDSVTNGIACAVTMQRAVAHHNRSDPGLGLAMRVGISTGETTCANNDYFGSAVVEARRLCDTAEPGAVYLADVVRMLAGSGGIHRFDWLGELQLKGLANPVATWRVDWDADQEFALRVALADDSVLLREGVASLLEASGIEVVLQAADAETVIQALVAVRPHVVVLDVRMPPTHTTEGLEAAEQIRADHPEIGVLVLSATVDPSAARRLLQHATDGIGYLLKDRVMSIDELTGAIRAVASGGSAIDPEVLAMVGT
jgi:class 3 adenylate cyclase/ActR/RegA family two-component response regulator